MTKPSIESPTLDEWRPLYDATIQIKSLAPWQWMTEDDVFGVQDPETGEIGYVSITGALGEHLSVIVYLGSLALLQLWNLKSNPELLEFYPEKIMEIRQLQASFEDRKVLTKRDRDVIKQLGLKFRGKKAWPMFRSIIPGYLPWQLTAWEARFLRHVLEQTLEVAPRLQTDPDALFSEEDEENDLYLIRVPHQDGDELIWEDAWQEPAPAELAFPIDIPPQLGEHVLTLPKSEGSLEIDIFSLPARIQEHRDDRPYFPYVLLFVDHQSGFIFDTKFLSPEPDWLTIWSQAPVAILELFARLGAIPKTVYVRHDFLITMLNTLASILDFKVEPVLYLEQLDEAKDFLMSRF